MAIRQEIINLAIKIKSRPELIGLDAAGVKAVLQQEITDMAGEISAAEFYEEVDATERDALTPSNASEFDRLLILGVIDMNSGTNARTTVDNLFSGGSVTQANLTAKLTLTRKKSDIWGFPKYKDREIEQAIAYNKGEL